MVTIQIFNVVLAVKESSMYLKTIAWVLKCNNENGDSSRYCLVV